MFIGYLIGFNLLDFKTVISMSHVKSQNLISYFLYFIDSYGSSLIQYVGSVWGNLLEVWFGDKNMDLS